MFLFFEKSYPEINCYIKTNGWNLNSVLNSDKTICYVRVKKCDYIGLLL